MPSPQPDQLTRAQVAEAYRLFLGRRASAAELEQVVRDGHSHDSLRRAFLAAPEFRRMTRGSDAAGETAEAGAAGPETARTLIHLHVPKSAGSTLSAVLAPACPPNSCMTVGDHDLDRLAALPLDRRRALRFLFGHLSHGVARHLPQPCTYVTVLREPGARLLSYFRYIQRIPDHPLHAAVAGQEMGFGAFLDYAVRTPRARTEIDNGQMRRLAGGGADSEAALFRQALRNVFAEDLIYGFTERFDDFLVQLRARGIPAAGRQVRLNAAPEATDITPEIARLTPAQARIFEGFTRWDRSLYEICWRASFSPDIRPGPALPPPPLRPSLRPLLRLLRRR